MQNESKLIDNMKKGFVILVAIIAFTACNHTDEKAAPSVKDSVAEMKLATDSNMISAAINSSHTAQYSLDWKGTYKGVLPCADCKGIETEIVLNADQTYKMTRKYLGKGAQIYDSIVPFTWINGSTIRLDGVIDGPSTYFVGEGTITQLDMNGKKIAGALAEKYVLKKQ